MVDHRAIFDPITTGRADARAGDIEIEGDMLVAYLVDGRELRVPVVWYPPLADASVSQRLWWRLTQDGRAIHWPRLGVAILVEELLRLS